MKKLVCLISIVMGLNPVFSQTKSEVESFLSERLMPFNKDAIKVYVNNLDSVMKTCLKKDISYSKVTFTLYGNIIASSILTGYSGRTVIRSKRKPFIFYKFYKDRNNEIAIEVVSGSDCL